MQQINQICPCGTGTSFSNCCGRFINDGLLPSTPEELMRSRYSAFTLADINYIKRTMKSPAADDFDPAAVFEWSKQVKWEKLEIVQTSSHHDEGTVEFIAHFSLQHKKHIMHEISLFYRENQQWFYVDGKPPKKTQLISSKHIGRNDPCICGSNKKYKKCCGQ